MKYVISLGGSLIVPGQIDIKFIRAFASLVKSRVKKGDRFFIVTGGGSVCRVYQRALKDIRKTNPSDLDWLGIASTKLNGEFMRLVFGGLARSELIVDPSKKYRDLKKVNIVTGWKPGFSTDHDAVLIAKNQGIKTIINLTNIDYVYDSDPKKNKNAKRLEKLPWNRYLKIVGGKWRPGANFPFDPVAARLARKHRMKAVIMNGKNLKNFENYLSHESFKGTILGD